MVKVHCDFCNGAIESEKGEGYIVYKGIVICTQCAIDLIPRIYEHDVCSGGLIKKAFSDVLKAGK